MTKENRVQRRDPYKFANKKGGKEEQMDHEIFDMIQRDLYNSLGDILQAYAQAGREPNHQTIEAFSALFDCSPNEFRKFIDKGSWEKDL